MKGIIKNYSYEDAQKIKSNEVYIVNSMNKYNYISGLEYFNLPTEKMKKKDFNKYIEFLQESKGIHMIIDSITYNEIELDVNMIAMVGVILLILYNGVKKSR